MEILFCKICNKEFTNNLGGQLTNHIKNEHNMTFENYGLVWHLDLTKKAVFHSGSPKALLMRRDHGAPPGGSPDGSPMLASQCVALLTPTSGPIYSTHSKLSPVPASCEKVRPTTCSRTTRAAANWPLATLYTALPVHPTATKELHDGAA